MADIEQKAKITQICGDIIKAEFLAQSACAHCSAKSLCSMGECSKKMIEINSKEAYRYHQGQTITVILNEKFGFYAVIMAYVLPLILLLTSLVVCMAVTKSEIKSGVISIIVLIPYYLLLILGNKYFRQKFKVRIKESVND